ncbi:MAG: metallophosphoesterase family protein, partial [Planctomycetota bacterium]
MKKTLGPLFGMAFLMAMLLLAGCKSAEPKSGAFSFTVTADMREFAGPEYQSSEYFMGTCEAIRKVGKGAFMISPGDVDPPQHVSDMIKEALGDDYIWYPAVGNHEAETSEDMAWLRDWGKADIPNLVRRGPENGRETTYSFDFASAHFAVLNQYYDGSSDTGANGDICDALYQWLKEDLAATSKRYIFVVGHEPLVSIPDADNGRHRHKGDNLDEHPENNHRFGQLLREHK